MTTIEFETLDSMGKRAVFWLADEAETLTTSISDAASHIGEIYEAVAFMRVHPKGSAENMVLAARLRLGGKTDESILACIERAAPAYRSIVDRADVELDDLLANLRAASVADGRGDTSKDSGVVRDLRRWWGRACVPRGRIPGLGSG